MTTSPYRRKRALRPSFVVTFAAAAAPLAATGCGAVVSPSHCGDSDGGAPCDANPPGCPASQPAFGTPCSIPETEQCVYAYHTACPGVPSQGSYCDARTHTWRNIASSCNPPPPSICPDSPPTQGSACVPGRTTPCTYGNCGGAPTTEARCDPSTSTWQVQQSSCNPPPPMCPPAPPVAGTPCMPGFGAGCAYGDCNGTPTTLAMCDYSTSTWQVRVASCNPPPPVMCPSALPNDGDPCVPDATGRVLRCDFGSCATGGVATATCDPMAASWRVVVLSCDDGGVVPPGDGGPPPDGFGDASDPFPYDGSR